MSDFDQVTIKLWLVSLGDILNVSSVFCHASLPKLTEVNAVKVGALFASLLWSPNAIYWDMSPHQTLRTELGAFS